MVSFSCFMHNTRHEVQYLLLHTQHLSWSPISPASHTIPAMKSNILYYSTQNAMKSVLNWRYLFKMKTGNLLRVHHQMSMMVKKGAYCLISSLFSPLFQPYCGKTIRYIYFAISVFPLIHKIQSMIMSYIMHHKSLIYT